MFRPKLVRALCLVQILFLVPSTSQAAPSKAPQDRKFCFFASSELIYENAMKEVAPSAVCEGGGRLLDNKVSLGGVQGIVDDFDSLWGAVYFVDEIDYPSILRYAQSRSQLSFMSQARIALPKVQMPAICRTVDLGIISSGFPFSSRNEVAFATTVSQYTERMRQLGAPEKYLRKLTTAQKWIPANFASQAAGQPVMPRRRVTLKTMNQKSSKRFTPYPATPYPSADDIGTPEQELPSRSPTTNQVTVQTLKQDSGNLEQGVTQIVTQKQTPGMQPVQQVTTISKDGPAISIQQIGNPIPPQPLGENPVQFPQSPKDTLPQTTKSSYPPSDTPQALAKQLGEQLSNPNDPKPSLLQNGPSEPLDSSFGTPPSPSPRPLQNETPMPRLPDPVVTDQLPENVGPDTTQMEDRPLISRRRKPLQQTPGMVNDSGKLLQLPEDLPKDSLDEQVPEETLNRNPLPNKEHAYGQPMTPIQKTKPEELSPLVRTLQRNPQPIEDELENPRQLTDRPREIPTLDGELPNKVSRQFQKVQAPTPQTEQFGQSPFKPEDTPLTANNDQPTLSTRPNRPGYLDKFSEDPLPLQDYPQEVLADQVPRNIPQEVLLNDPSPRPLSDQPKLEDTLSSPAPIRRASPQPVLRRNVPKEVVDREMRIRRGSRLSNTQTVNALDSQSQPTKAVNGQPILPTEEIPRDTLSNTPLESLDNTPLENTIPSNISNRKQLQQTPLAQEEVGPSPLRDGPTNLRNQDESIRPQETVVQSARIRKVGQVSTKPTEVLEDELQSSLPSQDSSQPLTKRTQTPEELLQGFNEPRPLQDSPTEQCTPISQKPDPTVKPLNKKPEQVSPSPLARPSNTPQDELQDNPQELASTPLQDTSSNVKALKPLQNSPQVQPEEQIKKLREQTLPTPQTLEQTNENRTPLQTNPRERPRFKASTLPEDTPTELSDDFDRLQDGQTEPCSQLLQDLPNEQASSPGVTSPRKRQPQTLSKSPDSIPLQRNPMDSTPSSFQNSPDPRPRPLQNSPMERCSEIPQALEGVPLDSAIAPQPKLKQSSTKSSPARTPTVPEDELQSVTPEEPLQLNQFERELPSRSPTTNQVTVQTLKQDSGNLEQGVTQIVAQKQTPGMQPVQQVTTISKDGPAISIQQSSTPLQPEEQIKKLGQPPSRTPEVLEELQNNPKDRSKSKVPTLQENTPISNGQDEPISSLKTPPQLSSKVPTLQENPDNPTLLSDNPPELQKPEGQRVKSRRVSSGTSTPDQDPLLQVAGPLPTENDVLERELEEKTQKAASDLRKTIKGALSSSPSASERPSSVSAVSSDDGKPATVLVEGEPQAPLNNEADSLPQELLDKTAPDLTETRSLTTSHSKKSESKQLINKETETIKVSNPQEADALQPPLTTEKNTRVQSQTSTNAETVRHTSTSIQNKESSRVQDRGLDNEAFAQSKASTTPASTPANSDTLIPGYTLGSLVPEFDLMRKAIQPAFLSSDPAVPPVKSISGAGSQLTQARSKASVGPQQTQSSSAASAGTQEPCLTSGNPVQVMSTSMSSANPRKVTATPIATPTATGISIQAEGANGISSTTQLTSKDGSNKVSTMSVSSSSPSSGTKVVGIQTAGAPGTAVSSSSAVSVAN